MFYYFNSKKVYSRLCQKYTVHTGIFNINGKTEVS